MVCFAGEPLALCPVLFLHPGGPGTQVRFRRLGDILQFVPVVVVLFLIRCCRFFPNKHVPCLYDQSPPHPPRITSPWSNKRKTKDENPKQREEVFL